MPPTALRLNPAQTGLIVIDIQERLLPVMATAEACQRNAERLVDGARVLGLPVLATEQFPQGIGPTVAGLRERLAAFDPPAPVLAKLEFSVVANAAAAAVLAQWRQQGIDTLLVCGVEAHVCVWQTVSDLLAQGYAVHVIEDATSSRSPENRSVAARLWRKAGAVVSSTEVALFDLIGGAQHPNFKAISKIIK